MIKEECKQKLLADLKNHTESSYRDNQKSNIPIVKLGEDTEIKDTARDHKDLHEWYPQAKALSELTAEDYVEYARHALDGDHEAYVKSGLRKCMLHNVKTFHFNDRWWAYKYSVDDPQYTFGILKVENMPYIKFLPRLEKKSFVGTAQSMIWQKYVEPFMVFVNGEFVDWNDISIVFDGDDTYLLLYGYEYTWYNLEKSDIHMVILPFTVEYYSKEDPARWQMMYDVLKDYVQKSMRLEDDILKITIPGIDTMHIYKGMVYHVGGWLYQQHRNNYLGLLTDEQFDLLRRIEVRKSIYDRFGNVIDTYTMKFNAFDKDSYDHDDWQKLQHGSRDYYLEHAIFRFDKDGILDNENGEVILSLIDGEDVTFTYTTSTDNPIIMSNPQLPTLYEENYIVFHDALYDPRAKIDPKPMNSVRIDMDYPIPKETGKKSTVYMFYIEGEYVIQNSDNFDTGYFTSLMEKYLANPDDPELAEVRPYLEKAMEGLDFQYRDDLTYEENVENALKAVIQYNPILLNPLYHTCIHSTVYDGDFANQALMTKLAYENRKGLKISRSCYRKHESYVLVFLNGELIPEYWNMAVYPNFFFIPRDEEFKPTDKLELLFFDKIDNNEIWFNIVDDAVEEIEEGVYKWNFAIDTGTFIPKEETKIFCLYPKDALIYQELIPESEEIAFNVSGWDGEDLLFVKDTVKTMPHEPDDNHMLDYHPEKSDRTNTYVAVSSHKFIYQRLYVDQKAYRLKLDRRFRFCDNQKQYALFINGRRMDDESFLVTIPKYTRPFWGRYIYVANFVMPSDRIEVFYLPEEFQNIWEPIIDSHRPLAEHGYFEMKRSHLDTPYDPRYYMVFINGKKMLPEDLKLVDSHTMRFKVDPQSTDDLVVIPTHEDTLPEVVDYLHGDLLSTYDEIIDLIRKNPKLGIDELDRLFGIFVKMSNTELPFTIQNVARIAILNEIIRDFWVSSGFDYQYGNFVYDYQMDDFFFKNEDGQWMLPAMDAQHNPDINIIKNDLHLLYYMYTCDALSGKHEEHQIRVEETRWYEYGDVLKNLLFEWEYSENLYTDMTHYEVYRQIMAYKNAEDPEFIKDTIPPERIFDDDGNVIGGRSWLCPRDISVSTDFIFTGSSGFQKIQKYTHIKFSDAVRFGVIDEDRLQHYSQEDGYNWIESLIALIPKDGVYKTYKVINSEDPETTEAQYEELNYVVRQMSLQDQEGNIIGPVDDFYNPGQKTVILDGSNKVRTIDNGSEVDLASEFLRPEDLQHCVELLDRQVHGSPEIDLHDFVIGNNNYFIFAAPYYMCFDNSGQAIEFIMPDPWSDDVKAHVYEDKEHQTPIYTSGRFLDYTTHNLLEPLETMEMLYLGEFIYTNEYGFGRLTSVWRSNGFYTRLFENYGFDIKVRLKNGKFWSDGLDDHIHTDDLREKPEPDTSWKDDGYERGTEDAG